MPISDALCQPKLLTKGSLYQALLCSVIGWSATVNAQSVEEAVAMTLSTHPDIRIAFTKFKVREEQVQQAEAGYLPNINVTAGYGYEYTNSPGTRATADETADLNRGEFGVSLKQSLFSGFQNQ